MRLLKNPNFDFMSKKLFALTISGLIGLAGIVSLIFHGGPKLSIDFKGGTFVAVQFTEDINVEEVQGIKIENLAGTSQGNLSEPPRSVEGLSAEELVESFRKEASALRKPE